MKRRHFSGSKLAAYALGGALALPLTPYAQPTDISNGPIGQPATSVNPNLMLILDDSGSMGRQFTPDYVSTYLTPSGTVVTRNCFDSLDSGAVLNETPEECWAGDPPAMSPDFNVQYYNAEIRYFPAVDYDGTPRVSMTCQNTGGLMVGTTCLGGWTAVTLYMIAVTSGPSNGSASCVTEASPVASRARMARRVVISLARRPPPASSRSCPGSGPSRSWRDGRA